MFLTNRFYIALLSVATLYVVAYLFPPFMWVASVCLSLLTLLFAIEMFALYHRSAISAYRICPERLSNGDDNKVEIHIDNGYSHTIYLEVIDEIPIIFQARNINFKARIKAQNTKVITYTVRPTQRGEYPFGKIRIFARTLIGLIQRRYSINAEHNTKVYPSFIKLRQYELLTIKNSHSQYGIKKVRRIANKTEFEQIKEYVKGDEYRHINWKASARTSKLMTNVYQDERSQQVYSVIDKGRTMQHAFRRITMLDYAINSALALSYIATKKDDKAGLITLGTTVETTLSPNRGESQVQAISQALYSEKAIFTDSDYEELYIYVKRRINKRSLLVIYTDFANVVTIERQIKFLKQMAKMHKVLVIIFKDDEIDELIKSEAKKESLMYSKVIAEKYMSDKQKVISTLRQNGITSVISSPEQLSVNVINKYLEIKSAGQI